MTATGGTSGRSGWPLALLAAALAADVALLWQALDVYFVLGGEAVEPTRGQERRYVATALAAVLLPAAGGVWALVRGRPLIAVAGGTLVALGLAASVLLVVPQDRFDRPDPAPTPVHPDGYEPCFSGSDCSRGAG